MQIYFRFREPLRFLYQSLFIYASSSCNAYPLAVKLFDLVLSMVGKNRIVHAKFSKLYHVETFRFQRGSIRSECVSTGARTGRHNTEVLNVCTCARV